LVSSSFSPSLSRDFLSPYRIHEISRRLRAVGRGTPEEIGSIQSDVYDLPRATLAAAVVKALGTSRLPADRSAVAILQSWNGDASVDATAPTLVSAIEGALERRLLFGRLGPDLDARLSKDHHFLTPVIRTLAGDSSLASIGVTRATVLAALGPATHDAEAKLGLGTRPLTRWGDVNAAVYAHPLGIKWPLTLLNAPTIPQPGDIFTVFQSRPDFGPSMRLVADLSDWDHSSMLLTLGESGVWTDPHYQDMERDWVDVAWSPTPFTDDAVAKAATNTLKLEP
jgi:penicillin amidase